MKKQKHTNIALIISAILIALIAFKLYQYNKSEGSRTQPLQQNIEIRENDIIFGSDQAPLTMMVFSDYNCKYCRRFFLEVYPKIQEHYIDTGKLKVIIKLVVLREIPELMQATQAVMCANQFASFEEIHQLLTFNIQVIYTEDFQSLLDDMITVNTDMARCILKNQKYRYIKQNNTDFKNNDLAGTPTFVIGDKIYPGYRNFEKFESIFQKHLSNATKE